MSHFVDFERMREKIFILNSLALSGELFSRKYDICGNDGCQLYSLLDYRLAIKSIVSNFCLELAVLIRNSKELYDMKEGGLETHKIITCSNFVTSAVAYHDFVYIANKIIHAKEFLLTFVGKINDDKPYEWWDGTIEVKGNERNGEPWDYCFDLSNWLGEILLFIKNFQPLITEVQMNSRDISRAK